VNIILKAKDSWRDVWGEKLLLFIALFVVLITIAVFCFLNNFDSPNDFYQAYHLSPPARTDSLFLGEVKLSIFVLVLLDTLILWAINSSVFLLNRSFALILVSPLFFFYQFIVLSPAIPNLGMEISLFIRASLSNFSPHAAIRLFVLLLYSIVELTIDLSWKLVCTKEVIAAIGKYRKLNNKALADYSGNSHLKRMYLCCILLLLTCAFLESLCAHVL